MDYYGKGLYFVEEAIKCDNSGKYEQAVQNYTIASDIFIKLLRRDPIARRKANVLVKVRGYIARAETLQKAVNTSSKVSSTKSSSTTNKEEEKRRKEIETLFTNSMSNQSNITFADIAGLEKEKLLLEETVILPRLHPQLFTGKRKPWQGILLYGPPGTGKTLLASALAKESNISFLSLSSSDIVSKFVGDSEKIIADIFKEARRRKPCIIFVDEIDSIATTRKADENPSIRRIKTELLRQLDGVGTENEGVLFLAATNKPWDIDSAMRRRFEKKVFIGLPDLKARKQLLKLCMGNEVSSLTDSDYTRIATETEGFSNADIFVLVQDALMEPVRLCLKATHFKQVNQVFEDGSRRLVWTPAATGWEWGAKEMGMFHLENEELMLPPVTPLSFASAMSKTRTTVSKEDLVKYAEFMNKFGEKERESKGVEEEMEEEEREPKLEEPSMFNKVLGWFGFDNPELTTPVNEVKKDKEVEEIEEVKGISTVTTASKKKIKVAIKTSV